MPRHGLLLYVARPVVSLELVGLDQLALHFVHDLHRAGPSHQSLRLLELFEAVGAEIILPKHRHGLVNELQHRLREVWELS